MKTYIHYEVQPICIDAYADKWTTMIDKNTRYCQRIIISSKINHSCYEGCY